MIFRESRLPFIAAGAVALMAVSAIAITQLSHTFERKDVSGKAIPLKLPNEVTNPGLAMEMARDNAAAQEVLDAGVDTSAMPVVVARQKLDNRRAMAAMQWWDFPLIVGYVVLFGVIAQRGRLLGFTPLKLVALAAGVTAIAAGCLDVMEDIAILKAISGGVSGAWPIWRFGWSKWLLVFLTMLLESSVFFSWTSLPTPQRVLTLLVGAGFFGVSLLGIQSMLLQCDDSLQLDAGWMFAVFVLLAIFTAWRFVQSLLVQHRAS
jgi:hypothetical protein